MEKRIRNRNVPSRTPYKRNCDQCGAYYESTSPRVCSKSCSTKLAFKEGKKKSGRNFFQGVCPVCQEPFTRKGYFKTQTCSHRCGMILSARKRKGQAHWPATPGRIVQRGLYLREFSPDHPNKDINGYVAHHRRVMERHIGRYLETWEKVHHRNAVKTDNRIENLEIVTHARPNGWVICPHCRKSFQVH